MDLKELREVLSSVEDPLELAAGFFAFAPVALQIYDKTGRSVLTNDAFRALFGSEPPPEYNVLEDEIAERNGVLGLIHRAFAGEVVEMPPVWYDPRELKQVTVTEGRRVAMQSTFFPLFDGAGRVTHVAITFRDRTDEMLAQEALAAERDRHLEERLREEIAIRERLLAIVGHDLRSPLAAITLAADMLRRRELPESTLSVVARISKSAARMDRMIRDLLDFTRARVGELPIQRAAVDAAQVIAHVLDELRAVHPGRQIATTIEGDVRGFWDGDRLAQLIGNLVGNALRHGAPDGPVTVRASGGDGELQLEVHNLGAPIAAEAQPRLFEPFIRGSGEGEGIGLGLFIVARIAAAHHGTVSVASSDGDGTTFTVKLPREG